MIIFLIVAVIIVAAWLYFKNQPATKEKQRGCLDGKTHEEKIQFFESLQSLQKHEPLFFSEQFIDLTPRERRQFTAWQKAKELLKTRSIEIEAIQNELNEALNDRAPL
jgi:hypothetical protein